MRLGAIVVCDTRAAFLLLLRYAAVPNRFRTTLVNADGDAWSRPPGACTALCGCAVQAEVCARWGGGSGGAAAGGASGDGGGGGGGGGAGGGGELLQLPLRVVEVVGERLAVGAGWDGNLAVFTRRDLQVG